VLVEDRTASSLAQRVCSLRKGAHLAVGTKCSLSQGSSRCEEPLLLKTEDVFGRPPHQRLGQDLSSFGSLFVFPTHPPGTRSLALRSHSGKALVRRPASSGRTLRGALRITVAFGLEVSAVLCLTLQVAH